MGLRLAQPLRNLGIEQVFRVIGKTIPVQRFYTKLNLHTQPKHKTKKNTHTKIDETTFPTYHTVDECLLVYIYRIDTLKTLEKQPR